jgi:hypothetical protein
VTTGTIEGEFKPGAKGTIYLRARPNLISLVAKNGGFNVVCKLPLCEMCFEHYLNPSQARIKATHRVVFGGFVSPFFDRVIGNGIMKGLPAAMNGLEAAAEKGYVGSGSILCFHTCLCK